MKLRHKLAIVLLGATVLTAAAQDYKVGVCDWMIGKRQKAGAFNSAYQIGADGIEMDMGGLGNADTFKNKMLTNEESARLFLHLSDSLHIEIGAIAMSGFYGQSFATKSSYRSLVEECLNTMDKIGGVDIAFLPLGGCGKEWASDAKLRKEITRRLREVGDMAAKRGKRIGIDTPLDAKGNKKLLNEIGSKGIGIFYKWQTAIELGVDIATDIKQLGAKNIVAFHASNTDSLWLRDDKAIDVPQIHSTLKSMGWSGWLFVERSRNITDVRNNKRNYSNNVDYLKGIFNSRIVPDVALDSAGRDPKYVANIIKRAKKATRELKMEYCRCGRNIENIVANRYFELNDIYNERDSLKELDKKLAESTADSRLYHSHFAYLSRLARHLRFDQIEKVKDVMTFNVLNVTYEAHCDMIPTLQKEEKQQIMIWLREARELAIDAENSKKKHEIFGRYKGRINNYLSQRGYDLTHERAEWEERVKARGGTL